jgi:hypothetical protein
VAIEHRQLARTRHRHQVAGGMLDGLEVVELHRTGGLDRDAVDRGRTRSRTTDVEGAHGQLGAGLADRLRGDHADRLADVDQVATAQVAAVAVAHTPKLDSQVMVERTLIDCTPASSSFSTQASRRAGCCG